MTSQVERMQKEYPITFLGPKDGDAFPIIENIWSVYAKKGNKTVFLSVGASKSCLPDLEIAETLGCPFHVAPIGSDQEAAWAEVGECLKSRSRPETAGSFSAGSEERWILPKNYRMLGTVPWWSAGTADVSGATLKTAPFFQMVRDICGGMKLKEEETRLDILKVDVPAELERPILMSMLENNLRPSMLLVRWNKMPDSDIPTSITAGHLQNCGYNLIGKIDDKFLYFFINRDVYMSCSWEDTSSPNPLVKYIVSSVQKSMRASEGGNNHARRVQETLAAIGEAPTESSQ